MKNLIHELRELFDYVSGHRDEISLTDLNRLVAHLSPTELETVVIRRVSGYYEDPDTFALCWTRQETDEEEAEREAAEANLKQAAKDARRAAKRAALEAERATYERLKQKFEK